MLSDSEGEGVTFGEIIERQFLREPEATPETATEGLKSVAGCPDEAKSCPQRGPLGAKRGPKKSLEAKEAARGLVQCADWRLRGRQGCPEVPSGGRGGAKEGPEGHPKGPGEAQRTPQGSLWSSFRAPSAPSKIIGFP